MFHATRVKDKGKRGITAFFLLSSPLLLLSRIPLLPLSFQRGRLSVARVTNFLTGAETGLLIGDRRPRKIGNSDGVR